MRKKGQMMVGQIFIYIASILIIGFLLVFGYQTLAGFKKQGEQVSYVKFRTDMQSFVKAVKNDFGTVRIRDILAPDRAKEVCFVDSRLTDDSITWTGSIKPVVPSGIDPIIADSIDFDIQNNVFFPGTNIQPFNGGVIQVNEGVLCLAVSATTLKIELEGKGNRALVKKPRP